MAHRIFGSRFVTRREPAWHGLGHIFHEPIQATQAVELAAGDYDISLRPVHAAGSHGPIPLSDIRAIVRGPVRAVEHGTQQFGDDCEAVLGTCSPDFVPITNMELARFLDPITERYPVETFGVLDRGERAFFCLLDPSPADVAGDEIRQYFTVLDSKIPGTRAKIFFSPVRVVCHNTLTQGIAQASIAFDVTHRANARGDMEFYTALAMQMATEQRRTLEAFRRMAATPITPKATTAVINTAFPLPPKPARVLRDELHGFADLAQRSVQGAAEQLERAIEAREAWDVSCLRAESYRAAAQELVRKFFDEFPRHANTVWGVYNACTELSDWRDGRGNIPCSVLFGPRAQEKARAFNAAMDYIRAID